MYVCMFLAGTITYCWGGLLKRKIFSIKGGSEQKYIFLNFELKLNNFICM